MDMRYAKLKRKIVLLAAAGTLAATLTAAALLRLLDHLLGNLAQRLFVWAATCLFGQSQQTALEAYQHYIVENVPFFLVSGWTRSPRRPGRSPGIPVGPSPCPWSSSLWSRTWSPSGKAFWSRKDIRRR